MSTRSNIGILRENGSVEMIYCHHDGYPEGVGATLVKHYTTLAKAEALLALGNLSSLGDEIETCCAYARDRAEKHYAAVIHPSVTAARASMQRYLYLWEVKSETWLMTDGEIPLTVVFEVLHPTLVPTAPTVESQLADARAALRAALPLLIRLGDYIGNDDGRCEVVLQVRQALAE